MNARFFAPNMQGSAQRASRRFFLRRSLAAGAAGVGAAGLGLYTQLGALSQLAAQAATPGADYRALVCVFLYGGNDANNLLVPYETAAYNRYAAARTNLALPAAQLLPISPTNTSGERYALHPAMTGVQGLFAQGKAAFVANVGPLMVPTTKAQWDAGSVPLPDNLFSHSDQQSQWQAAVYERPTNGWGGRLMERLVADGSTNRGYSLLSVTGGNLWETGDRSLAAYKVSAAGNFGFDFYNPQGSDPLSMAITDTLAETRQHLFEQGWVDVMGRAIEAQRILSQALSSASLATAFPNTGLGNQLKMVARLVAARNNLGLSRQCFFCSLGGFDTHGEDQLTRQNELFGEISGAVTAFQAALVELGAADKVTLFTASDFGRNFASNGRGSDHGWGSHHLVVGGAVNGGRIVGRFPEHVIRGRDDADGKGSWIPSTSVESYAATLGKWFGASPTVLGEVFPRLRYFDADLGLMT